VAIATPDFAHTEFVLAALEAGKHVIVEKPMAMSTRECKQMLAARDASGKKLMVNYHNRWYPAFVEARRVIAEGRIGQVVSGNFVLSDTIRWVEENMTWADKSGPEWFLMSHIADLAFWMVDDAPVEVFAMAREGLLAGKGFATRDTVKATMRMSSGSVLHFETSWVLARGWRNPVNEMWTSVQGETGRVDTDVDHENITITAGQTTTPFVLMDLTEAPPLQDFVRCMLDDTPVPVTGEEAMLATQAVEAVQRSYEENRVVRLDEIE
jgi:predicted dehydrogenase